MKERLERIISTYSDVDPSTITYDTVIASDLGLNSIAIIEMIGEVEDEFDVEITDADIAEIKTVGELIGFLEKNI